MNVIDRFVQAVNGLHIHDEIQVFGSKTGIA